MTKFDRCMDVTLKWEGGYVDHPRDPGGATNMGITHITLAAWRGRRVTKAEVRALTKAEAKEIYRARYWDKVRGDDLPPGLDLVAFDGAVNSGPRRGAEWLQEALGVTSDGVIGPKTIAAAQAADPAMTINVATDIRLSFLMRLNTWNTFGEGWGNRVADIRANALRMASRGTSAPTAPGNPLTALLRALVGALKAIFGGKV